MKEKGGGGGEENVHSRGTSVRARRRKIVSFLTGGVYKFLHSRVQYTTKYSHIRYLGYNCI